ncbi:MAG TPA: serine/threonine-protein kinase [Pirellulales bacterium]|jgi:serine/threonine-protein kinase|nr:serine/threonine-protein kinase [Pirellulales bacterium]
MSVHHRQETPTERRDRLCREFAEDLGDGNYPRIEDYVGRLPEAERPELLTEFVRRDHACRWQVGEPLTLNAYKARFSGYLEAIARACFTKPAEGGVRYALVCVLADGAQARVYLARDNERDEVVVVKVARESTEKVAKQFRRESQFLAKAGHCLIVPMLDYFELAGRPFVVLEYIRGKTLASKLKTDGPFSPPEAAWIIEQIADATHHVHETMTADGKVLIHRDLKPAHIILHEGDGKPRLLDFGLADYEESGAGLGTSAHHGTMEYMSPEQVTAFLQGVGHVDRRSDVWALGAVMFEILTGRRLFGTRPKRESFESTTEWARAIEKYFQPRIDENSATILPDASWAIPEPLCRIVERCVEKRPDARYRSAGELAHALRQWRERGMAVADRHEVSD